MRFNLIFFFIFFAFINHPSAYSQRRLKTQENTRPIYRVHCVLPGLSIEKEMIKNSTLVVKLASGLSYYKAGPGNESVMYFNPYIKIETRRYLNLDKRAFLGKRTDYFSGQFTGLQLNVGFANKYGETWQSLGPMWGFQRTLWKRCFWNVELGLGLINFNRNVTFTGLGDFGFGIILN